MSVASQEPLTTVDAATLTPESTIDIASVGTVMSATLTETVVQADSVLPSTTTTSATATPASKIRIISRFVVLNGTEYKDILHKKDNKKSNTQLVIKPIHHRGSFK